MTDYEVFVVRDTLSGALYPQPNQLIAGKVAEMHGSCEVLSMWHSEYIRLVTAGA